LNFSFSSLWICQTTSNKYLFTKLQFPKWICGQHEEIFKLHFYMNPFNYHILSEINHSIIRNEFHYRSFVATTSTRTLMSLCIIPHILLQCLDRELQSENPFLIAFCKYLLNKKSKEWLLMCNWLKSHFSMVRWAHRKKLLV
jgi:hypothetical protein